MKRTRTPESLRALGEATAKLTPEEQIDFLNGFITGHDRLAQETHRNRPQGQEDQQPVLHDAVARAVTKLRDYIMQQQKE